MIVGLEKSRARGIVVLQYGGSLLELLPDDPDRLPVDYTAQVVASLERILNAHQMAVVSDTGCPVLLLLATHHHHMTSAQVRKMCAKFLT